MPTYPFHDDEYESIHLSIDSIQKNNTTGRTGVNKLSSPDTTPVSSI